MKTFALLFNILDGPEAEVERGGLEGPENLLRDQVVQRRRRDVTAVLGHRRPLMLAAVIAGPLGRMVATRHSQAALAAHDQPLQERLAAFGYTASLQERTVLLEFLLIFHVLIPGDIGGQPIPQEHWQLLRRHEPFAALDAASCRMTRPCPMQSISIGTGVDRMSQDRQDSIGQGGLPLQLPDAAAPMAAKSQSQVIHGQITEDRVRGAEFLELIEDQLDHSPRLFVGLLDDLARRGLEVSQRNQVEELATLRLVPAAAEQAIAESHQLEFAHRALHPQEKAIVAVQRIVDPILIAKKCVEDRAHVDELMPILARPG
jgi:hypothetical protein